MTRAITLVCLLAAAPSFGASRGIATRLGDVRARATASTGLLVKRSALWVGLGVWVGAAVLMVPHSDVSGVAGVVNSVGEGTAALGTGAFGAVAGATVFLAGDAIVRGPVGQRGLRLQAAAAAHDAEEAHGRARAALAALQTTSGPRQVARLLRTVARALAGSTRARERLTIRETALREATPLAPALGAEADRLRLALADATPISRTAR